MENTATVSGTSPSVTAGWVRQPDARQQATLSPNPFKVRICSVAWGCNRTKQLECVTTNQWESASFIYHGQQTVVDSHWSVPSRCALRTSCSLLIGEFSPCGCGPHLPVWTDVIVLHHKMTAADSLTPVVNHCLTPGTEVTWSWLLNLILK